MSETSQTAISDNGAGALAYVTVVPAIVFLFLPPYNASSYVRFHAWQSQTRAFPNRVWEREKFF